MNHTAHFFKALFLIPVAATLSFSACSDDWDDHYNPGQNLISGESLWEAIESNPELSNFASVLKATGYDRTLSGQEAFSIFAPLNSNFTSEEAQNLISTYNTEKAANTRDRDNTTIKEFVQNHLALYNHSVYTGSSDSLVMMNGKYQILTENTFAGHTLASKNQAYANGLLYTIDGEASYLPNVFEYLSKDNDLDSVANFLNSYNEYVFDAANSVPGDIVDGKTQYLDSVVNLQNDELHGYLGLLDSEDSTYWFVAPTNEVWRSLVPQYEKYFNYDKTVDAHKRDSLTWANARMALLRGTAFSRTVNTDASIRDSAMSTAAASYDMRIVRWGNNSLKYYQFDHPFASDGIFDGTTNVSCSNGQVMKANRWHVNPLQTFLQEILIEGEDGNRQDSINRETTRNLTTYRVQTDNPFYNRISNHSYVEMSDNNGLPFVYYSIPDMLSGVGYDIYVVTAPAIAGDTLASENDRKPTMFNAYLRYQDANGKLYDHPSNWLGDASSNWILLDGADNTSRYLTQAVFTTHSDQMDVFKVGNNVSVPYTTYGLGQSPKVELILRVNTPNSGSRARQYNRILRIDEILVVPHTEEQN